MGFGAWGLGFGIWGLGPGVWGWGFGAWDLRLRVYSFGIRVWSFGSGIYPEARRRPVQKCRAATRRAGWGFRVEGLWSNKTRRCLAEGVCPQAEGQTERSLTALFVLRYASQLGLKEVRDAKHRRKGQRQVAGALSLCWGDPDDQTRRFRSKREQRETNQDVYLRNKV